MSAVTDLIDRLKYIADAEIVKSDIALGAVQNSAQILLGISPPGDITPTSVSAWASPTLPALPALPTLPGGLKIDYGVVSANVAADVTNIQNSWMAKFLPAFTDVSALDSLFTGVLGGSQATAASAQLTALADATKAALAAITASTTGTLSAAITASQNNLTTNFGTARTGVASALAIAGDNTQNIAWNVARDQVTREAARKERSTISQWASRGFNLPGGVLTKLIARSQQDTQDAVTEIAGKQAVETQKLFFDTARLSVETYLKQLEVQTSTEVASFTAAQAANLRLSELSLDANKFNARTAFEHLQLRVDFTKFSAELATRYRVQIVEAVNALVNAYASLNRSETEYVASIANAQRGAYAALTEYFRAAIQYGEYGLKATSTNQAAALQYMQTAAQYTSAVVGHKVAAATAAADGYARIASTAVGGLNAVLSTAELATRAG